MPITRKKVVRKTRAAPADRDIFGAPLPLPDHCQCAVAAAPEMIEPVDMFGRDRSAVGKPPSLIDDATRAGLRGQISVDALGPVPLRGKARSVDVFAVPIGQKS